MTRLVLTNANLLDGDAPARANRVVVIEGDRIASVGDTPPADVTAADRVVDLGGRTVMPGMITCHYHSTYRELGSTLGAVWARARARVPGAHRRRSPPHRARMWVHRRGRRRAARTTSTRR